MFFVSFIKRGFLPLFLALLSVSAFSTVSNTGMIAYSATATGANFNCAAQTASTTVVIENGNCDFYRRNDTRRCSELITTANPYWSCTASVVYCSISGSTAYSSSCQISNTPFCTSGQFFNTLTGRCDTNVTCTPPTVRNPATNQCDQPFDCSTTSLTGDIPNAANNACECPSGQFPYHDLDQSYHCASSCNSLITGLVYNAANQTCGCPSGQIARFSSSGNECVAFDGSGSGSGGCPLGFQLNTAVTPNTCDPQCQPPQDLDTSTHQCANYSECQLPSYYSYSSNSCITPDACTGSGLTGGSVQSDGSCGCSSSQVLVTSGSIGSPTSACVAKQECTPSSPNYGLVNGLPTCSIDRYCAQGEAGGIVNGRVVCVSENPCDYDSMVLDPEKACTNKQKDLDNNGTLDGGDEGVLVTNDNIKPPALPSTSTTGNSTSTTTATATTANGVTTTTSSTTTTNDYSPITNRQDQQTTQLTKSVAEQTKTNIKLDTANNNLSDIKKTLTDIKTNTDTSSFVQPDLNALVSGTADDIATTMSDSLAEHTGSDIGSIDPVNSALLNKFSFFNDTSAEDCASLSIPIPHTSQSFGFNCEYLNTFKDIAGFIIYLLTIFTIVSIVFRRD